MSETSIEEMLADLDLVMEKMNEDDITLEDSFSQYKKGMELLKACNDKIETVEKQVLILDEEGMEYEF